jgi:transposase-like protein/rubredoxin
MDIITYLIHLVQYLYKQNIWLLHFICKYIPLRQWAHDDSTSSKYQKFKTDALPLITDFRQGWDYKDLIPYYEKRYGQKMLPVSRRTECDIPDDCHCPRCAAPKIYLYKNNGSQGQLRCKVCDAKFTMTDNRFSFIKLRCPYCGNTLVPKKDRKHFILHKCVNPKCSYYRHNLKNVDKKDLEEAFGKNKYKLHYIYREFTIDFFKMNLDALPKNASSLKFTKFDAHVMSLCLTMHVNLSLSLRKTAQALKDLYNLSISHQQVANYCRSAAICVKPFVDNFDYNASSQLTADETYIKVKGIKGYIWFIMDAVTRSILGYQVSDNRGVGPCILAMRMAFRKWTKLPDNFRFVADGYSAYPLAAQQFFREFGDKFKFEITQVIGLTNDDAVSKEFRPFKQLIERLNRTYKASYRPTNGFSNMDGANYDLALWVAYYNFLRPHKHNRFRVLNEVYQLNRADNMPGKWQLLILMGQQTILKMNQQATV